MKFTWPWPIGASGERLALGGSADAIVYAHANAAGRLQRCGVVERGEDSPQEFGRRLRGLGLPAQGVCAVLPLAQAQLLQVDAPAVRPEEMKAAARWKVKDLVNGRVEDMTIDVMFVGDERARGARHLFVTAARNDTVRDIVERSRGCGLEVSVIDLAETTQRNLQSALARAQGLAERANAALVRHGAQCLLTICAGDELFYARRLDFEYAPTGETPLPALAAPAALAGADALELHGAHFIDYGAEPGVGAAGEAEAPRLVIELQRSFDVWERSWPDLPLAALWVEVGEDSPALAAQLQAALGQRVGVFDVERIFPGFAAAAGTPAVREAVFPVLGALLRHEARKL